LAKRLAKLPVTRDDEGVEGRKNEGEFYREIIRRAKEVRERAAEALRRPRGLPKRHGDLGEQADAAERRRTVRRRDRLRRERRSS
jgi:hypothetical protein